jgi:hypothetical protein
MSSRTDSSYPHHISLDSYPFDFATYGERCYVPVVNGKLQTEKKIDCRLLFEKVKTSSPKAWRNISGLIREPKSLSIAPAVSTSSSSLSLSAAPATSTASSSHQTQWRRSSLPSMTLDQPDESRRDNRRRRKKRRSTRPKNQPFIVHLPRIEIIQFKTARVPYVYVSSERHIDMAILQMQDMFAMLDPEKQTIGIDIEGHNNHGIKKPNPWNQPHAMLVQISIYNHTWLWDLYELHSSNIDTNHTMNRIYNEVLRYGLLIFAGGSNDLEFFRQCRIKVSPGSYVDILPSDQNCVGQIERYIGDGGWREDLESIKALKKKRSWLANWKKRPLSQEMVAYAVFDSYALPRAFASILRTHEAMRKTPHCRKALDSIYERKRSRE